MSILVLFNGATTAPSVLPVIPHTVRASRRYKAERIIILDQKDPNDTLDYEINWAAIIGDDTISISAWGVPSPLVGVSGSNTSTTTTAFFRGGSDGTDYSIINKITTTDGRIFERSMILPVRDL